MSAKFLRQFVLIFALLSITCTSFAADQGTSEEAKALVKKAVVYLKEHGKEKFLAEANNKQGDFVDRDLYLIVYDLKGVLLAIGFNIKLNGRNLADLRDAENKPFVQEIISKAKTETTGWVKYRWSNPITLQLQDKSVYFEKSDDIVITCGNYID